MKKLFLGLLVTSILAVAQNGDAQASLPFLTSKAALNAYAVEKASLLQMQLSSPSQAGNQNYVVSTNLSANHVSGDITKFFTQNKVTVPVLNPLDTVYLDNWVQDANGNVLLFGSTNQQPVNAKGGYTLLPQSISLQLNSEIPITFSKQVSYAEMMYVDPVTGRTINYQAFNSYGNTVYFQTDSAGMGDLKVTFTDGTEADYDLQNQGVETSGLFLSEQPNGATIENLFSYTNAPAVTDTIPSQGGIGENRTYEMLAGYGMPCPQGYTCVPASPVFKIGTSEGAVPTGYWYRMQGVEGWSFAGTQGVNGTSIPFTANGTWYVIPDWDPNQFREPAPVINDDPAKGEVTKR